MLCSRVLLWPGSRERQAQFNLGSFKWETDLPPGSQPDWRAELEGSFVEGFSQCWKTGPKRRWWRSEERSSMAGVGPGPSSTPSQPATMGEPSTDTNVSYRKKTWYFWSLIILIFLVRGTALEKLTSVPTDFILQWLPYPLDSLVKIGQKVEILIQKICLLRTASDS